jgi:tripeptide aminopeptidase
LLNQFLRIVQIDSVSTNERAVANYLREQLLKLGLEVHEDNAGQSIGGDAGNLIAKINGDPKYLTLLFMAHMDTVSPGKGIKPSIKDGIICSDGTTILGADDAIGLSSILEALEVIKETAIPHGNIEVVFTVAEEIGLKGVKNLDTSLLTSKLGFCLDGGGPLGTVITQASAHNLINFIFKGKAAHAGAEPEKGISAIQAASYAISTMNLGRIDVETTANIGIIQGGEGFNTIPAFVKVNGEARSLNPGKLHGQTVHMVEAAKAAAEKYGAEVECIVENSYSSFNIDTNSQLVQISLEALSKIGVSASIESTGGGSDANILNGRGIPTLVFGINDRNAHTVEESIPVDDLIKVAEFVVSIIETSNNFLPLQL